MPSRNVLRIDVEDSFYHVYSRGASRQKIFLDSADYKTFLNLLKRYLSAELTKDPSGRAYTSYYGAIELLSYCLMPNHVHLLFYQQDAGMISHLMRCILTSYSRYFNKKYSQSGPLFESRYKASRISSEPYLEHISRYIHLNPKNWREWQWSSLDYYTNRRQASWVRPGRITGIFIENNNNYLDFLEDYVDRRDELKAIVASEAADL